MEKNDYTYQAVDGRVSPLLDAPVENIGDAKRTLGRLILAFQQGAIESQAAKTLCYLLVSFSAICKDHEMEKRIDELEKRIFEQRFEKPN
jgi:hypothetical protein